MAEPLAYLITWTTYGSWLPGDERGWVEKGRPGIQSPQADKRDHALDQMAEGPVVLNSEQRAIVAKTIEIIANSEGGFCTRSMSAPTTCTSW